MGTSGPSRSMYRLSMPRPARADIRCSTVATLVPLPSRAEHSRVSVTRSGATMKSLGSARSIRRKTMPVSTAAGRRVRLTLAPVCRPTPVARTRDLTVRCRIMSATPLMKMGILSRADRRVFRPGQFPAQAIGVMWRKRVRPAARCRPTPQSLTPCGADALFSPPVYAGRREYREYRFPPTEPIPRPPDCCVGRSDGCWWACRSHGQDRSSCHRPACRPCRWRPR
jgi:hypothetical protein